MDQKFVKVGRHESCPCGSGLRFKSCHGSLSSNPQLAEMKKTSSMEDVMSFAPLSRDLFSRQEYAEDFYQKEVIPKIVVLVDALSDCPPEVKGKHLGKSLVSFRKVLQDLQAAKPGDFSFFEWVSENASTFLAIDAHIALNALSFQTNYQVSAETAAQMVSNYVLGPQLDKALNESKDGDPEMSLGIDFIEHVVSEIVD